MNRSWTAKLLMFVWLSVGYGVAHLIFFGWGISVVHFAGAGRLRYEYLVMTEEGEPLIQESMGNLQATYRRLDGTAYPDNFGQNLKLSQGGFLSQQIETEPTSWMSRITSMHDFRRPTTYWYVIVPPERHGRSYFVGYDELSRQLIGYLGKEGFSRQIPAINHCFETPNIHGGVTGSNISYWPVEPVGDHQVNRGRKENVTADSVWVLSNGSIYEIQLGTRTVRTLIDHRPDFKSISSLSEHRDDKDYLMLLLRSDRELSVIDPQTKKIETIEMSPLNPDVRETIYFFKDGKRIVHSSSIEMRDNKQVRLNHLTWIKDGGKFEREEDVILQMGAGEGFASTAALITCVPLPLFSLGATALIPIAVPKAYYSNPNYWATLSRFALDFRWWILSTLAIGIGAGWACRRREMDVFHSNGWFWPLLVGLTGWFGWVAYICIRPLPARLPNREWMPDRPAPTPRQGTEIYA